MCPQSLAQCLAHNQESLADCSFENLCIPRSKTLKDEASAGVEATSRRGRNLHPGHRISKRTGRAAKNKPIGCGATAAGAAHAAARTRRLNSRREGRVPPCGGFLLRASAPRGVAAMSVSVTPDDHLLSFPRSPAHSYFISYSKTQLHPSRQTSGSERLTPSSPVPPGPAFSGPLLVLLFVSAVPLCPQSPGFGPSWSIPILSLSTSSASPIWH